MRRSQEKILTTHVGSLPGDEPRDAAAPNYEEKLGTSVEEVVARQRDVGLDIINEGEYTKGGDWLSFMDGRLGGCEARPDDDSGNPAQAGRDRQAFAEFYKFAAETGTLHGHTPGRRGTYKRLTWYCTGPFTYIGQAKLEREIKITKAAAGTEDVFLTSTAPASLEPYYRNEYYDSQEAFILGMAEALRTEYEAIVDAGLILQIDDAWLPVAWDRSDMAALGLDGYRDWCRVRIEALNHALSGIPEDRVRYHLCWGSWRGPHAFDIELKEIVDIMLSLNAGAYLIEAANARHEHEYVVWDDVKLPEGKILVPGVVSHATDHVEHPELVAQRICRFAERVGRENVMAGTDCGFGGRSHPQIAWAKLKSLADGAKLASEALGY